MSKNIRFTILITCKNEEHDIRLSVESSIAQKYKNKEIICVDDSSDNTKKIILEYENLGVQLIDGHGHGCCMARNLGLHTATGDVIVFLTADTKLEPDYLEKIAPYYEEGYDIVVTSSYSYNLDSVYSRFIEMQYRYEDSNPNFDPLTTQGYSVRRVSALDVGGISGGRYPFNTCRDWTLVRKMEKVGCRKIYDRKIVVPHKSPDNFKEYWMVRKTRGLMSAFQPYYLFGRSKKYLFCKFIAKDSAAFLNFILVIPWVYSIFRIASFSSSPSKDFFKFLYTAFIQEIAAIWGEWQGFWMICNSPNKKYDETRN